MKERNQEIEGEAREMKSGRKVKVARSGGKQRKLKKKDDRGFEKANEDLINFLQEKLDEL